MIFSLDVRRARKGDCLLLHFGSTDTPGLVMIDGGPKAVYAPHLQAAADEDSRGARPRGHQPLPVDLLMVSHVDDDHIQGILDLTRELREAAGAPFVRVRRFWHNSFDAIIGNDPAGARPAAWRRSSAPPRSKVSCPTMPPSKSPTTRTREVADRLDAQGAGQHRPGIPPAAGRRGARQSRSTRSSAAS